MNIVVKNLNLEEIEKQVIFACLKKNEWNRTHAAKELGINVRTLSYKIRSLLKSGYKVKENPKKDYLSDFNRGKKNA